MRQVSVPAVPAAPRRERKKRQTRDALIQAALELFEAKGYDQTTVHEITDAVDVSERTYFRYFASKEDLALSFVKEATEAYLRALEARPPEEDPLTAVRAAFRESLRATTVEDSTFGGGSAYLTVIRLIESTPTLLAAHLRWLHEHDDDVVQVLAQREGVDPATDRRPRLVAGMVGVLASLATKDWKDEGCGDVQTMLAAFDAYADQLGPSLFGHWRAE